MISWTMLKDVWAFRGFILSSVRRDLSTRFVNTRLGVVWLVIGPLTMILIYTLLFAGLMKPLLPGKTSRFAYSVYLCSGLITWELFNNLLKQCMGIFVRNAHLLKKIHFPKLCLPLVAIFSSLIDFTIIFVIFLLFLSLTGLFPGVALIAMVPLLAIVVAFSVGFGIFLGTVNVFYRDVEKTMHVVLQFWFWLTPIVYVPKTLPSVAERFLSVNPLWPVIDAMHRIFLEGQFPQWETLLPQVVIAGAWVFLGMFAFWRLQGEIVDEL